MFAVKLSLFVFVALLVCVFQTDALNVTPNSSSFSRKSFLSKGLSTAGIIAASCILPDDASAETKYTIPGNKKVTKAPGRHEMDLKGKDASAASDLLGKMGVPDVKPVNTGPP